MCIFLTGCTGKDSNNENLKQKTLAEVDYIGNKIITTINMLNNITLDNYIVSSKSVEFQAEGSQSTSEGSKEGTVSSNQSQTQESQTQNNYQGQAQGTQNQNPMVVTEMSQNNVLTTNTEEINWDVIKQEVELINDAWGIVVLDLYEQKINNNEVLEFSTILDYTIISVNNENKEETLNNLSSLYSVLPKYLEQIGAEGSKQSISKINSNILKAYSSANQPNWIDISNNLQQVEQDFLKLMEDVEYISKNDHKVKQVYVEFKELQNALPNQDQTLFYVKYKNLMQSLNTL